MKLAVSGKGGVGKTTFSSLLIRTLNDSGKHILAIDADPDANLAGAIGIAGADSLTPIAEMKQLVLERTGAQPGTIGGYFRLNPKVDDLPDSLSLKRDNIKMMRLGGVKKGGAGCICPESSLLRALVRHVVVERDEFVILDMEAGIEHLGRGTAKAVDKMIIVVEPGRRSIDTAGHIKDLSAQIGLSEILLVGNKVRGLKDENFLKDRLSDFTFLGFIPYDEALIEADLDGLAPYDMRSAARDVVTKMASRFV